MATICGLPICLWGINISTQVLSVKRSDSCCVQSRGASRTAEMIVRKDYSSSCIAQSLSSSLPPIPKEAISLFEVPVTTAQPQSVEKRPISTIGKRRQAVINEMVELDRRREILKLQRVFSQECNAAYFQLQDLYALQQSHSAPNITQALFNRVQFCLEDGSETFYDRMAANAA
ncbi:hypothetical protein O6H91_20G033500 [Diphasiastrum complanatum]|uniref:Uncharacterized protein n=1 Tax=Diphasiastrum complanatum TaxID=34168 RepID=A0ACC2AP75_DIPCM|nr:hypothetical protein O6H91_20G033500 [Diphasiastrum complanatum]